MRVEGWELSAQTGRMSAATADEVVLLVGTVKGVFIYRGDAARKAWRMTGPHLGGWEIFSLAGDARNGRIIAGAGNFEAGATVRVSGDGGKTWEGVERAPKLAETTEGGVKQELKHLWLIVPGHPSEPGTWWAGADDAALFVSRDDARTWTEVRGLTAHATRPRWVPGFGGLCLHSIVVDRENSKRLWVGISAVGVFRTDDAGATWKLCNEGLHNVAPEFITDPEMGRCVHRMVADPVKPGVLWMQYHGGVFKSENGAESWTRISAGLPNDFGFPMAVTRRGDVFIVPLLSDNNRVVPDGALKVWRTRDGGRTWRALTNGLPQKEHFVGVLRGAMDADGREPGGIYFGTTAGEVFASRDDGENWERLPGVLPRVTCVRVWEGGAGMAPT